LTDPDPSKRLAAGDAMYISPINGGAPEYFVTAVLSDTTAAVMASWDVGVKSNLAYYMVKQQADNFCGVTWWYKHWIGAASQPALYPQYGGYFSNSPFTEGIGHRPTRAGNNGYTMVVAMIALGLATAEDDPRGVKLLERYQSLWFDYYLPVSLGYTTGFQNTGASYSFGRTM